jgi:nuclear cap-binding protein subunit 2
MSFSPSVSFSSHSLSPLELPDFSSLVSSSDPCPIPAPYYSLPLDCHRNPLHLSSISLFSPNPLDDHGLSDYLIKRRKFYSSESWIQLNEKLKKSKILYVGNLDNHTYEEQIYEYFHSCAPLHRFIMGLNRDSLLPCGFCFVEFSSHSECVNAHRMMNSLMLDERSITAEIDPGYEEGRQFGRSKASGVHRFVREERRVGPANDKQLLKRKREQENEVREEQKQSENGKRLKETNDSHDVTNTFN